jgi:ABC-type glycerol-3-phosphate transport system substrate-binding protein
MKRNIALAAALGLAAGLVGCNTQPAAPKKNPDAVKVEFFVMSQCPFGVQVVDNVKEAVDKLGPDIDFQLNYIGNSAPEGFSSLHGQDEVTGDIVQLCAMKHAPATTSPGIPARISPR